MTQSEMQKIEAGAVERLWPPRAAELLPLQAPVASVTLLEDRARVVRRGRAALAAGRTQLYVTGVAPVLQDLSLRAVCAAPGVRVADVRVRRAMRVRKQDRPAELAALEEAIRVLCEERIAVAERARRLEARYDRSWDAVGRGLSELPVDAGWGLASAFGWREGLEPLFRRTRELRRAVLDEHFTIGRLSRDIEHQVGLRRALDRSDARLVAWAELDVLADAAGEVELVIEYTCPNALWRPLHSARLAASDALEITSSAVVWQNTGEDWNDAELSFSTARASLGTEPPRLADDRLTAQRKTEQLVVEAREVAVQRAGVGASGRGAAADRPSSLELPGVDDGGEVRNLLAPGRHRVPSDGRPNVLPLFTARMPAETTRVCMPELDAKVFVKSVQSNAAASPLLPGPVELAREGGFVGWTDTSFVAPGERFELGFGPDEALRVVRRAWTEDELDPIDKWRRMKHKVAVCLSNVADAPRRVRVVERIPVSEVEHVTVTLDEKRSTAGAKLDADGFVSWEVDLPGYAQALVELVFTVAYAPGVHAG